MRTGKWKSGVVSTSPIQGCKCGWKRHYYLIKQL